MAVKKVTVKDVAASIGWTVKELVTRLNQEPDINVAPSEAFPTLSEDSELWKQIQAAAQKSQVSQEPVKESVAIGEGEISPYQTPIQTVETLAEAQKVLSKETTDIQLEQARILGSVAGINETITYFTARQQASEALLRHRIEQQTNLTDSLIEEAHKASFELHKQTRNSLSGAYELKKTLEEQKARLKNIVTQMTQSFGM